MGILLFFPSAGPATWEMTFTLEGTSPIDVTGQKTDVTFEMAFTCEGATTVVATTTLTEATWAMAFTNEGVTTVVGSGQKSEATFEMAYTCEGVSTVAATGGKTDATWEMAHTVEGITDVVASGVKGTSHEMAHTLEGITTVVASGQNSEAIFEMAYTCEGITTVVSSAGKSDITWEMAFTNEGVSTVAAVGEKGGNKEMAYTLEGITTTVASGGKTDVTFEMAYTNEGITTVVGSGGKTDATWEMAYTNEGITTTVATGSKSDVTWAMTYTNEGITTVVGSGSKSDATWAMEYTNEGITTVVASGQVSEATWEMSFTNEGVTTVVGSAGKTDVTWEMSYTCEGVSTITAEGYAIPLGETREMTLTTEGRSDIWAYGYNYLSSRKEMKFRCLFNTTSIVQEGRSFAGVLNDSLIHEWHGARATASYGQGNYIGTTLHDGMWWDIAGGTEAWRDNNKSNGMMENRRNSAYLVWWNYDHEGTDDAWQGDGTESNPYALKMDGVDTYLEYGLTYNPDPLYNYQLNFLDTSPDMFMSAEVWWKSGTLAGTEYLLELDFVEVDENHEITSADSIPRFSIRQKTDGKIYAICRTIGGSSVELAGTTNHKDSNFHHVVVSVNGVNGSFYLWVDGVLENSGPVPGSASSDYAWNAISVGANTIAPPNNYFFSGSIAAIRIYNQAMDDVDVLQNYLAGPHRSAYIPMVFDYEYLVNFYSVAGVSTVDISATKQSSGILEIGYTCEGVSTCESTGSKEDYINEADTTNESISDVTISGDIYYPWIKDMSYTVIGQSGATITSGASTTTTVFCRIGCSSTIIVSPSVSIGPRRGFRHSNRTGVKQATIFRKQKRVIS